MTDRYTIHTYIARNTGTFSGHREKASIPFSQKKMYDYNKSLFTD